MNLTEWRFLMSNFIVFEGICCSGKTTVCGMTSKNLSELGYQVIYNHGAFTDTKIGREFKNLTAKKDISITTLYYVIDLIINTQNVIIPHLSNPNAVVLQDRYIDSIVTYIKAFGDYRGYDYDINSIFDLLLQKKYLIIPTAKVFCIPPYEVITGRLKKGKSTIVHDYYKQHPRFLRMVYDEIEKQANSCKDSIKIDTISDMSITDGIENLLTLIRRELF
jgi:thymidylate kinase